MFRIDEKDYESLDAMPPETRAAVEQALASSSNVSSKIGAKLTVNCRTLSSVGELPVAIAAKHAPLRTNHGEVLAGAPDEPLVSPRLIAGIALFLLILLMLRFRL